MRSVGASPLVTPFQSLLGSEVNARFCLAMLSGKQTEILCMQGFLSNAADADAHRCTYASRAQCIFFGGGFWSLSARSIPAIRNIISNYSAPWDRLQAPLNRPNVQYSSFPSDLTTGYNGWFHLRINDHGFG